MKIGIVLYPTFGGSGVVATELGIGLAEAGHEVHFITYDQPVRLGSIWTNIFYHEVTVTDYPLFKYAPYELILTSKLVEVVEYHNLDLLHVHYAIPHASAAFMARAILRKKGRNIPFITTLHGTDITLLGKDASYEPVITFAINESDAVTAVSESLKKDTLENFQVDREVQVIPNFIDIERYHGLFDQKLRDSYAPNGEKILVHTSNFRPVKRIEDILHAFAKLKEQLPVKLLLIGDGPERSRVQQLCKELNTCDSVQLLGKLKRPEKIMAISDLYIQASEHESFGLSALEAMACGVPVVSTDPGGIPEVVEHGVSGLLGPVGGVEQLAKNAYDILHDPAVHERYKANASARSKHFDIHTILPEYIKLYEGLVIPSAVG
ncbi:MAG: N-acetyl-alpha-D-glucosaminyl L-malate synthase BshA [Bacteroidetes bacterium]|jgi:L-malate glycosyltransferase|nr:N-acetyl-alpha-D-glucosaminyl L-malate synthase BshA [Bacteroidota bacterium]